MCLSRDTHALGHQIARHCPWIGWRQKMPPRFELVNESINQFDRTFQCPVYTVDGMLYVWHDPLQLQKVNEERQSGSFLDRHVGVSVQCISKIVGLYIVFVDINGKLMRLSVTAHAGTIYGLRANLGINIMVTDGRRPPHCQGHFPVKHVARPK